MVTPRWTRDGGVGAHVQASAAALAERGVSVAVLAAHARPEEGPGGVEIFERPQLLDRDEPMDSRIGDALAGEPTVVHMHQVHHPDLIASIRERVPVVASAHDYVACPSGAYYFRPGQECTRAHGPGCIPNMLLRGCTHGRNPKDISSMYAHSGRALAALRGADVAVSYSSAVDRHLAANGLEHRALVPYFGTTQPREASGHEERRRVVFAGRIVATKGVDVLVRAAREVDADFVICGEGRQLEEVRGLARRLGIDERVRFTGWLSAADLARELAEASVVAVPSLWPEPFGLVGIEALGAGRPVVASATGGVIDWLEDGRTGLLVAPGDAGALARALSELLDDPERQRIMGAAGRDAVAARFSPERHVTALLSVYERAHASWADGSPTGPSRAVP
jgi:glycosyltransferase involved in cell wall biosynthesis